MYPTMAQLPVAARQSPEQKQQQQQQEIILAMAEKSEDLFHHVQHDWNFGGIKLQQSTEAATSSFNGVIQTHQGVIKVKNLNTISVGDVAMPSVEATQTEEVVQCIGVEGDDDAAAILNCGAVSAGVNVSDGDRDDNGVIGLEADEDDDDEAEEEDEEDDDDPDDSDAVRDIVDELQQQHRQLLKEQQQQLQQQQRLEEQQHLQEQENIEQRGHLTYEQAEYEVRKLI